jgi:high-affinity nickel-transport protein
MWEAGEDPARSRHCDQLSGWKSDPTRSRTHHTGREIPLEVTVASPPSAGRNVGMFRTMLTTWNRRDWVEVATLLGVIVLLHILAFTVLFGVVGPAHYHLGTKVFGVGLGITAYTYGLRHAFDADHIAAIDNTTRKLRGDGRRPKSVGFWFAMGHSSVVAVMAALVAAGAHIVADLTTDGTATNQTLGFISTGVSGCFLYVIAILNLVALVGIVRVFRAMRAGEMDEARLEHHLQARGLMNRILGRLTRAVTRPGQMFPVGLLFGLGFDTATEVALLVLAGTGAASGLPWYAIMVLPLLFAAGMSLLDCLDGLFMSVAYDWAFLNPVRKVYYNVSITGLSVAVAFLVGTIELVAVLHDNAHWTNPVTDWVSGLNLNNVGFVIVGLFVITWIAALGYWRLAKVEDRWTTPPVETEQSPSAV